jgi:hypothetical protein
MVVFFIVTSCSLLVVQERFGGTPSALKIEAVCSSETFVYSQKSTRHKNPEGRHLHLLCLLYLRSKSYKTFSLPKLQRSRYRPNLLPVILYDGDKVALALKED